MDLDRPDTIFSTTDVGAYPAPPAISISGYRPLNQIGRGGQAVVYLGVQESTSRQVAIKVMREGPLADARQRARFDREVKILAGLDHPNLVSVLDRGITSDGSQYLTMNYIAGQPLDEYLKSKDREELLGLFVKIANAVDAAHQRGIVHRDLKPSNIRVDSRGEPQILDFGLARSLTGADVDRSVSMAGTFVGSLPWASPEQANGATEKIDCRSDVYALGVLLYQMLTGGQFPYPTDGNLHEALSHVLSTPPRPPSRVTRTSGADKVIAIHSRQSRLRETELDTIVLKALAKRREDRYLSAGEFARAVTDFINGKHNRGCTRFSHNLICAIVAFAVVATAIVGWRIEQSKASAFPSARTNAQPSRPVTAETFSTPVNKIYSANSPTTGELTLGWEKVNADTDLRVELDVRTSSNQAFTLISKRLRTQEDALNIQLRNDGGITAEANGDGYLIRLNGQQKANDNNRHHVALEKRAGRLQLWVDQHYEGTTITRPKLISSSPWTLCAEINVPRHQMPDADFRNIVVTRNPPLDSSAEGADPIRALPTDAKTIDLLPLIDPARDAVAGPWLNTNGYLRCDQAPWARLQIPHRPPAEYDYRVSFTRLNGGQEVALLLTANGKTFTWEMGGLDDAFCGFERVGGLDFIGLLNPTVSCDNRRWLINNHRHTCVIRVRKNGVAAYLDNQPITQWVTDFKDISPEKQWAIAPGVLGLGCQNSGVIFHEVSVTEAGDR
jgi:serine/threonine protein kinase